MALHRLPPSRPKAMWVATLLAGVVEAVEKGHGFAGDDEDQGAGVGCVGEGEGIESWMQKEAVKMADVKQGRFTSVVTLLTGVER